MPYTDPDTWYSGLPGVVTAAGALITDDEGRVLLVKPNYREMWTLPGGTCEFGEAPDAGCRRELAEELGMGIEPGPLLAVDWSQPFGPLVRPIMHFIFDGGALADGAGIKLQREELDGFRFTADVELPYHLPAHVLRRVTAAVAAREQRHTAYLPARAPAGHPAGPSASR